MKFEVVVGTLWVDGVKHRRGDIVELANPAPYGVRVQRAPEPPKPKAKRKVKSVKADAE